MTRRCGRATSAAGRWGCARGARTAPIQHAARISMVGKAAMRHDIGWIILVLAGASAIGLALWAIRSGYLQRRREGQPASAAAYLVVGLWLLIDTAAFNLALPGGEIVGAVLAVFCLLRAVQLRRRSGVWRRRRRGPAATRRGESGQAWASSAPTPRARHAGALA